MKKDPLEYYKDKCNRCTRPENLRCGKPKTIEQKHFEKSELFKIIQNSIFNQ